jgi:hypothetical protein
MVSRGKLSDIQADFSQDGLDGAGVHTGCAASKVIASCQERGVCSSSLSSDLLAEDGVEAEGGGTRLAFFRSPDAVPFQLVQATSRSPEYLMPRS